MEKQAHYPKILKSFNSKITFLIKKGSIGVIPTDTIYGIVGNALNKKAVDKIYKLRHRNPKKPMIILVGQLFDLKKFSVLLKTKTYNLKPGAWPHKTSIVFPVSGAKFRYLHRGINSLAFRLPRSNKLRSFLKKTGPLVAPSANVEGKPPAKTIEEAQKYFGDKVDFYIDAGRRVSRPSKLIQIKNDKIIKLRK